MSRKLVSRLVGLVGLVLVGGCSSAASTTADGGATGGAGGVTGRDGAAGGLTGSGGSDGAVAGSDAAASDTTAGVVSPMFSFFVTSQGSDAGGNLGGLPGADMRCQMAATKVGAGGKTWHAYLSLSAGADGKGEVNARDRIGTGPWYNVRGVLIAADVASLHEESDAGMNGVTSAIALDENGNQIPTGDPQSGVAPQHDILTGSTREGRAFPSEPDYTCAGWTSNAAGPPTTTTPPGDASVGDGGGVPDAAPVVFDAAAALDAATSNGPKARVGHVDRSGSSMCPFCTPTTPIYAESWNSAHPTPGCSQDDFVSVGGTGRLYCFAISR